MQSFYLSQQDSPHNGNQTHKQFPPCLQSPVSVLPTYAFTLAVSWEVRVRVRERRRSPACWISCRLRSTCGSSEIPSVSAASCSACCSSSPKPSVSIPAAGFTQGTQKPSGKKGKFLLSYKQFLHLWGHRQSSKSRSSRTAFTVYPAQVLNIKEILSSGLKEPSLAGLRSMDLSKVGCRCHITVHILP